MQSLANSTGSGNTAVGGVALLANTEGNANSALGVNALFFNTTGSFNTAVGASALTFNNGSNNTAIGSAAGTNATASSNSIFMGNDGLAADTATIKIGTQGTQNTTFIAGIFGAGTTGGVGVQIDSTGKLGTTASSRRYKEDIHPMGAMSDMLARLRPVSFRYKKPLADGSKPLEYGLIAEEVAEEFPYLAVFNEEGQPETVKYHLLPTFLLEGFQEQQKTIADLQDENAEQRATIAALEKRLSRIEAILSQPTITASASR